MKMECCGKVINTPYCPICGKEASAPESLLAHLKQEAVVAARSIKSTQERLDPSCPYYHESHKQRNESYLKTARAKRKRIEDWIHWIEQMLSKK